MLISELVSRLDEIAPLRLAEAWDNVGLIVGDAAAEVSRVLLCIDLTPAVLVEAISLRCDAVVAYHPPVFEGLKKFGAGEIAFEAARRGVAVYSPHTALDVAQGGTNDVLAEMIGLTNVRALKVAEGKSKQCKFVTFVPAGHLDAVADAIFAAGAGRIGKYSSCSFQSQGTGTFFGEEGTNPAVGQAGKLERTDEVRLETVVPMAKLEEVIAAMRKAHPYEEPAFDLNVLAAPPETLGIGRVGDVEPTTIGAIASRLKDALNLEHLIQSGESAAEITRVAVCAGAGRSLVGDVIKSGAQLFVTGELPHHDALKLAKAGKGAGGVAVLLTLHSNSERAVLGRLADKLEKAGVTCVLSERDRDPFSVV